MLMVHSMRLVSVSVRVVLFTLSILGKYALRKHAYLWDLLYYIKQNN